jgi:Flp pilus assembly protein TadD
MLKESIDLHRQGRLDEAELGYRARLSDHPDDVDALHMLGLLCHQRGDDDEGLALLERARGLAPADASIEATLAGVHFRQGDHAAAKQGYQHALALNPNIGGVHSGLGQIAMMQRDLPAAEQHFRTALRAGDDALALAGLGALTLERGDVDTALGYLTRAATLAPDDATVQTMLGQAFAQRGTLAFAEQSFANAPAAASASSAADAGGGPGQERTRRRSRSALWATPRRARLRFPGIGRSRRYGLRAGPPG